MAEAELMYECQVCYKAHRESELIAVKDIEYRKQHRIFPWHICYECAKKIVYAIKEQYEGESKKE